MPYENEDFPGWNWPSQASQSSSAGNPPNWWERNRDWVMEGANALVGAAGTLYSNRQNRKAEERAAALQREFAQHGIRWRVEDAKAAGLHPLAALGMQPVQANPIVIPDTVGPDLAAMSQNVSRAVAATETQTQRAASQLALELARSQIRETDARAILARAEAYRALNDAGPGFPGVNVGEAEAVIGSDSSTAGGAVMQTPRVNMARPEERGVVAGPAAPVLKEYRLPGDGNLKMLLPEASSVGEAVEGLSESWAMAYMVYKENARHYGEEWRREFLKRYLPNWTVNMIMGRPPSFRRFEKETPEDVDSAMRKLLDEVR